LALEKLGLGGAEVVFEDLLGAEATSADDTLLGCAELSMG
jgi:hypothetical protein